MVDTTTLQKTLDEQKKELDERIAAMHQASTVPVGSGTQNEIAVRLEAAQQKQQEANITADTTKQIIQNTDTTTIPLNKETGENIERIDSVLSEAERLIKEAEHDKDEAKKEIKDAEQTKIGGFKPSDILMAPVKPPEYADYTTEKIDPLIKNELHKTERELDEAKTKVHEARELLHSSASSQDGQYQGSLGSVMEKSTDNYRIFIALGCILLLVTLLTMSITSGVIMLLALVVAFAELGMGLFMKYKQ